MTGLPFAHGGPPLRGRMRASPEDFEVDEMLGFEADGAGEHAWLHIEKRAANTEWVAQQLARAAGVAPMAVGFSGLKDRHAVTRQTFSVHLPGRADPDWQALEIEGVRILESGRHSRKLKRGVHRSNRFRIRLCELDGDRETTERVLAQRVEQGTWDRALDGEVWMLAGTHSIFGPQPLDDDLRERLLRRDIDPTGPLWGAGELRSGAEVASIEAAVAQSESIFAKGLADNDLRQERRSLCLHASDFTHEWLADGSLVLAFSLPSGAFATSVVRELCATVS